MSNVQCPTSNVQRQKPSWHKFPQLNGTCSREDSIPSGTSLIPKSADQLPWRFSIAFQTSLLRRNPDREPHTVALELPRKSLLRRTGTAETPGHRHAQSLRQYLRELILSHDVS